MRPTRYGEAIRYANELHRHQLRKGANIPCNSQLISFASFVIKVGDCEDQAIRALLHDAAAD